MVNRTAGGNGTSKSLTKQGAVKNICVYCGAGLGAGPVYAEAARTLGRAMAAEGIGLVYGGASVGLMGEIARAVLQGGGHVIGIRPPNLPLNEIPLENIQELIEVRSLHERKMLMFERADAFVALPGGVGTLEELVEQITWVQLGHHSKPVVLANLENYWQPLLGLFEQMRALSFISPTLEIRYSVADRVEDIIPLIRAKSVNGGAEAVSTAGLP